MLLFPAVSVSSLAIHAASPRPTPDSPGLPSSPHLPHLPHPPQRRHPSLIPRPRLRTPITSPHIAFLLDDNSCCRQCDPSSIVTLPLTPLTPTYSIWALQSMWKFPVSRLSPSVFLSSLFPRIPSSHCGPWPWSVLALFCVVGVPGAVGGVPPSVDLGKSHGHQRTTRAIVNVDIHFLFPTQPQTTLEIKTTPDSRFPRYTNPRLPSRSYTQIIPAPEVAAPHAAQVARQQCQLAGSVTDDRIVCRVANARVPPPQVVF